jgi:hypothetical protein
VRSEKFLYFSFEFRVASASDIKKFLAFRGREDFYLIEQVVNSILPGL